MPDFAGLLDRSRDRLGSSRTRERILHARGVRCGAITAGEVGS
jgi:hypothetical protein